MKALILDSGSDNHRGLFSRLSKNKHYPQQTIIVEFNGLTGLGKTSVTKVLIEELNKLGYKTVDRYYRYTFLHSMRHPFPELFSPRLYWLVKSFAKSLLPPKKRSHIEKISYFAQKYKSIEKHSHVDFAIIDEAIIQFFAAIAFSDRIPVSTKVDAIVKKLKKMNISFVRVDCVPNIDEAEKRIMSRPSKRLKVERMQKSDRLQKLEAEAANINYLRTVFSKVYEDQQVITIDTTTANPIENAQIVLEKILKIKNNNENTCRR